MHQTVHLDDSPGPMDRPRQDDSLAGNMAGQIIGISCGSVGTPLINHERRSRTQQQAQQLYGYLDQRNIEAEHHCGSRVTLYKAYGLRCCTIQSLG